MTQKTEEKLYQQVKKDLDSEMAYLDNRKSQIIGQIDELDSRKDWIDWVVRFGKDINKKFQKVSLELLEGLIDEIVVHPIMGKDRDEKEIQVGHELQVFFDLPISGDTIKYSDPENKKKDYTVVDGKKKLTISQEIPKGGGGNTSKKNC